MSITITPNAEGGYVEVAPGIGSYYAPNIMKEQFEKLKKARADAFDRWNWETGAKEDREEFDKLDEQIKYIEENYHIIEIEVIPSGYAGTVQIYGSTNPHGETDL